ncbi:MAG: hypothetical protein Q4D81_15195, partial [Eubacteriales bacterium]|nr:hypothetical protein [Eubacteriales bacterium]
VPDQRKAEAPDQRKAETPVKTNENEKKTGEIGLREEKKSSDSKEHEIDRKFEQEFNRFRHTVSVANRSKREIEQYFNEKPAGNTVGRKLFTEAENQLENKNYKKAFELYCKCSTYLPGEFSYLCYCKAVCCSHLCSESYGPLVDLIYKGGIERNSGYFPHVENRMSAEGQEFLKWEQEGKKWNEKAMRLTPGLDARDGVKIIVMGGKDYFGCDHFHYLYK